MIDATKIEELLTRAEGLQRQIEDLEGLRDVVLLPVAEAWRVFNPAITQDQINRLVKLPGGGNRSFLLHESLGEPKPKDHL